MRIVAIIGLALMAPSAFAQSMGMYVGAGLGEFDFAEDPSGVDPVFGTLSDSVSSWKVYGGFEFNDYFGIEIGYGSTSRIETSRSGNDPFFGGDFSSTVGADFTTSTVKGMGYLPLEWGALLGGIGYFSTQTDVHLDLTAECCGAISGADTVSDDGAMAMLGLEWRFGRFGTGVGIRLEYEWLDATDAAASTVGIGASYRF